MDQNLRALQLRRIHLDRIAAKNVLTEKTAWFTVSQRIHLGGCEIRLVFKLTAGWFDRRGRPLGGGFGCVLD